MKRRLVALLAAGAVLACSVAHAQAPRSSATPCVRGGPPPQFTLDFAVSASRPPLRLSGTNRLEYAVAVERSV